MWSAKPPESRRWALKCGQGKLHVHVHLLRNCSTAILESFFDVFQAIRVYHKSLSQWLKSRALWRIGRVVTLRPKGCGFESRSSRHVVTLGKSFTRSCLLCFSVKLRHSICAVLGAPMSSRGFEEAL